MSASTATNTAVKNAPATVLKTLAGAGVSAELAAMLANQDRSWTTEYTSTYTRFGREFTTDWTIVIGHGQIDAFTEKTHIAATIAELLAELAAQAEKNAQNEQKAEAAA